MYPDILADRRAAILWAQGLLRRNDWVICDTETTGLSSTDEIVSIGLLGPDGTVLLDSLVRPTCCISAGAASIHGITEERVANAPTFAAIYPTIHQLLLGKQLVIYNAEFDIRMLWQSGKAAGVPQVGPWALACVMEQYAMFHGQWNERYGNYRWQPLRDGDHSAIGDCRATLTLIKLMAASEGA